jgi:hypothetical protein
MERNMEILPFGLFGDESRERPTGGLADYRQVKPWKKRDISERIVLREKSDGKKLKTLETQRKGGNGGRRKLPAPPKLSKNPNCLNVATRQH